MSNLRSEPLKSETKSSETSTKRDRPRVGFLRPSHIERAFLALLYLALLLLILLSLAGTFYGWRGIVAPLTTPWRIVTDMAGASGDLGIAFVIQLVLSLTQYGARQMARHDRRWWFLYLAALAISVYYNFQAYWTPLTDLIPVYVAAVLIIAGDVLPEFLAVRHE